MDKVLKVVPVLLVLGLVGLFLLWRASDDDGQTAVGTGTSTTATSDAGDDDGGATSTEAGGGSTTSSSSTTAAATTTSTSTTTSTTAPAAPALELPPADQAAPPMEPLGVYRDGKLTLGGSVPDPELAAAYLRRAGGVIGMENVTMQMTLDPRVSGQTLRIDVDERFQFPTGSTAFDPEFEALLGLGVAALQLLPESTLVVTGHTDDVGSDEVNQALSQARAQIVVDFMVRGGIPPERVVARGAGESEPIADNATPEGRQANRRIEATLEGVTPG